jgi:hypothetical protein
MDYVFPPIKTPGHDLIMNLIFKKLPEKGHVFMTGLSFKIRKLSTEMENNNS